MGVLQYQPTLEKNIFTQVDSDNGDYGQENNSEHITNIVLVHYLEFSESYAHNAIPWCTTKTLRRSLDVPLTQLNELLFMRKPDLPKIYSEINALQILKDKLKSKARIKSTDLTTTWILVRMTGNKFFSLECNQKTSNWTGFRELTSLKVLAPTIIDN